jgi:hypothetical protein
VTTVYIMTDIKKFRLYNSKSYIVFVFENESRGLHQSLYFLTLHKRKLIPVKNMLKETVENDTKKLIV